MTSCAYCDRAYVEHRACSARALADACEPTRNPPKETTMPEALKIKKWKSKRFGGVGAPDLKTRILALAAICIHVTQGHEVSKSAQGSCSWADTVSYVDKKTGETKKGAGGNFNFVADADEVWEYAPVGKLAWHAEGANPFSCGVEIAGDSNQNSIQWLDAWSVAALKNAAQLCALLVIDHGIEIRKMTDDEIRAHRAGVPGTPTGFFGHVDANRALGVKAGHYDPGAFFPWLEFLTAVSGYVELELDRRARVT